MNATKTMAKKHGTKTAFLTSLLSLILCVTMLVGTTLAWFTDTVTSGENQIIAGNLDVDAEYSTDGTTWSSLTDASSLFSTNLWEPGHTEVVYIKVVNKGTLAFNYSLKVSPVSETSGISVVNDAEFKLSDYLKFGTTELSYTAITPYEGRDDARADATLTGMQQTNLEKTGVLYAAGDTTNSNKSEAYTALVVYMPTDVGNEANYKTGTTPPKINLGVTVYAWQEDYENDSFGNDYDILDDTTTNSYSTGWSGESAITPVKTTGEGDNETVDDTTLTVTDKNTNTKRASALVPKETQYEDENGNKLGLAVNDNLKLTVDLVNEDGDITVESGSSATTYDVSLLRVVETTVSDETTTTTNKVIASAEHPIKVSLDIGVVELQKFYHKGTELTAVATLTDVDALGEYYYDVTTGTVTFMTDSFSNFTSVYRFAGGLGTEEYPYQLATAGHWYEMCTMNSWEEDSHYIWRDSSGCYVELTDDIDFSGWELPYSCYIYYLHLDGKGHTISNVDGATLFDNDGSYLYGDNYFTNLNVKNCDVDCSLFGYGTKNATGNSATFENVTVDSCSAQGGTFLYYCGSGTATFKDCTVTNTNVIGGYMASGGYIGNISTGVVSIDNCKFGGSVVSTQSACGGFLGQPANYSETAITIKNSEILAGTVIKNIAGGSVAAFDGHNGSHNYAIDDNTFNGTLITSGDKYKQGTDAATADYTPICTAADFKVNDDGTITYNGDATLEKVSATTYVQDDYIYYEKYYGGYNWNIETVRQENITNGTTINGLTKITDMYNVVSNSETPVGLQITDTTYLDEIHDGVFYFDAQTYSWGHYMLSGTYNSSTGGAVNPTTLPVYVKINVYDETGALSGVITGTTLKYDVTLHTVS